MEERKNVNSNLINNILLYVESGDIECIVNILGLSISPITLGGENKYGTSDEDVVSSFPGGVISASLFEIVPDSVKLCDWSMLSGPTGSI
jgi:hypothetical protein